MRTAPWVLFFAGAAVAAAQAQGNAAPPGTEPASGSASAAPLPADGAYQVIREIHDPHSEECWLLVRDWSRPGGPGRLVLQPGPAHSRTAANASGRMGGRNDGLDAPARTAPDRPEGGLAPPEIHPGDRLIVEEHTPVVEARLSAIAFAPAAAGAKLQARLDIGGKVVLVVALGPGRARLAEESEGKP